MWWRIARREWRDGVRDRHLMIGMAAVAALSVASVVVGERSAARARAERARAMATMHQQWLDQGEKNPHSAAHFGIWAFRPVGTLYGLDPGVDAWEGQAVWLEAHRQNPFRYRPVRDQVRVTVLPIATVAGVLQFVIPLLVLLIAATALVSEREQGTQRLLLGYGVPIEQLFAGKVAAILGWLCLMTAPLAAAVVVARAADPAMTLDAWRALGFGAVAYLLFLTAVGAIGLVVSARARSARRAVLTVLALWFVGAVLLPRGGLAAGRLRHPTRTLQSLVDTAAALMAGGVDGHDPEAARMQKLRAEVLARYNVNSVDALPVNFAGISLNAGEEYGNAIFDRLYADLWAGYTAQLRWFRGAALLTPVVAVQHLSMALAGSDWATQREFAAAAERWRRRMVRQMNDEVTYRSVARSYGENLKGREVWATVPPFAWTPPPATMTAGRLWPEWVALSLWVLLPLWWGHRTVRRTARVDG